MLVAQAQLRTRLDKKGRETAVQFLIRTYGLQKCQSSYIGNIKMGAKRYVLTARAAGTVISSCYNVADKRLAACAYCGSLKHS